MNKVFKKCQTEPSTTFRTNAQRCRTIVGIYGKWGIAPQPAPPTPSPTPTCFPKSRAEEDSFTHPCWLNNHSFPPLPFAIINIIKRSIRQKDDFFGVSWSVAHFSKQLSQIFILLYYRAFRLFLLGAFIHSFIRSIINHCQLSDYS